MTDYDKHPRRVPPGLLKTAAYEFRTLAEKQHGCNIGMGALNDPARKPCACHYGRLADECWLAALDMSKPVDDEKPCDTGVCGSTAKGPRTTLGGS